MTAAPDHLVVPALYARLLDDAAIFPPGNAPMREAVVAHAATLRSDDAPYVGTFLCSSDRLAELQAALPPPGLELSLVVRGGADALAPALSQVEQSELDLRAVEIVLEPGDLTALTTAVDDGVVGYVELPFGEALPAAVGHVAAAGCRVKLRTGGVTAQAFPDEEALAAGIEACVDVGVAFKLTAGLHHAVRHRDPATGFEHHGFLNVLVAVARAVERAPRAVLASVLAEHDASLLVSAVTRMDDALEAQIRSRFVSFGTCSTRDPLEDLRSLGLIPRKAP